MQNFMSIWLLSEKGIIMRSIQGNIENC